MIENEEDYVSYAPETYGSTIAWRTILIWVAGVLAFCGVLFGIFLMIQSRDQHAPSTNTPSSLDAIVSTSPTTTVVVPDTPILQIPEATTIEIPSPAGVDALAGAGQETQDQWFLSQVADAGVTNLSSEQLLGIRSEVCAMLEQSTQISQISRTLAEHSFTEQQQGVTIGAAMISACPNTSANVLVSDLPE